MNKQQRSFAEHYGPWTLVAGASEGLGEAFARAAAAHGLNLILVARRPALLEALAAEIRVAQRVEVQTLAGDLADPAFLTVIERAAAARDIGLLIYNAALSVTAPFLDQPLEQHLRAIDINCRAPLRLTHSFGQLMRGRGRGGIVLMSSLTGFQGSPLLSTYGATKAFNLVLGEGLWDELEVNGIDVLVCAAGATTTPGYLASRKGPASGFEPAPRTPEAVAREALDRLGRGPVLVPGFAYRLVAWILHHLVSRRAAVRLMGKTARSLAS